MAINGRALREFRKQKALSMAQLAEATGCSTNFINKLELGRRRRLNVEKFERMRGALGLIDGQALMAADPLTATEGAAA